MPQHTFDPSFDPAMRAFSETEILPVIKSLVDGNYRLPLIQQEFDRLYEQIEDRYPLGFEIVASDVLNQDDPEGRTPFAVFGRKSGRPSIAIFLPVIKFLFVGTDKLLFENLIVIGFLHEMIHLAMEYAEDNHQGEFILREIKAWAETCRSVTRLYVEIYREGVHQHDWNFYSAWIQCEGNAESDLWKNFIKRIYGVPV